MQEDLLIHSVIYRRAAQTVYLFVLLFFIFIIAAARRLLWLLFFASMLFLQAGAQTKQGWYLSKILNDNNGLPQNSIRSMYYDKKTSFLWLATEAGLVRYDGKEARGFDRRDMPSLQSTRIINLLPDINGNIIACTSLGEAFAIQQNYPEVKTGGQSTDILRAIGYRRGNIKTFSAFPMERELLKKEHYSPKALFNCVWLNDSLWMAEGDTCIFLAANNRTAYRWPKAINEAFVYYIVRNNYVYAIDPYGQGYCIDLKSKQQTRTKLSSTILSPRKQGFYYDKINDRPLMITGNEVHEILFAHDTLSTKLVAVLPHVPSSISSIVFDKTSRYLFVGTGTSGLFIYHLSPFQIYKTAGDNTENNNYGCLLIDSNHIFTNQSILFDLTTGDSKKIANHVVSYGMAMDAEGYVWHGNQVSSFSFKKPDDVMLAPSTGIDGFITAYKSKSTDRLWISTGSNFGYAKGRDMQQLIKFPSLDYSFHYITETPSGEVIGSNSIGVFRADTVHKKLIPELTDTAVSQIRSLYVDADFRCWITTYGNGIFLYHLKTKRLTRLPVDDMGYLQYSHAFVDDGKGNFLVPTNKGLFRLSKANLLQIDADAATSLNYQYYDVNDGLLTNEFNGGFQPGYNYLPNDDIILPALQGLVRVKMAELPQPSSINLFIDRISTKQNVYNTPHNIFFDSDERTQTWSLGFTQWEQPNRQGIFYRLDDNSWQRLPAGERNIQLSELTGGRHTLEIKYQYGLEPRLFTSASYPFSIKKYYYEAVWFWLLLVLLLLGIIYLSVRIRSQQLKQKTIRLQKTIKENTAELSEKNLQLEETLEDLRVALKSLRDNSVFKDRLLGVLGHDMLLPLRFIVRIANHLSDKAESLSPQLIKENGNEIRNTVTELLYLGEGLIQWIKLQEGRFRLIVKTVEVRQLIEEIVQVNRPLAAVKNNQLLSLVSTGVFCRYDPVFLKVILHNLLLNANKFTTDGTITTNAWITNNELHCTVHDTGTGMNLALVDSLNKGIAVPSELGTNKESGWGMGYLFILDLLRFAGGKLQVESKLAEWTTIRFSVPLTVSEEGWT